MSHFLGYTEDNGKGNYYEEPDLNNPNHPNPDQQNPDYWWRYEEDQRSEPPGTNASGSSNSSTSGATTSASTTTDQGTAAYLAFLEKNKHLLQQNSPETSENSSKAEIGGRLLSALKSPTGIVLVLSLLGYGAYITFSSKRKKHV